MDRATEGNDYTSFVSGDNRAIARRPANTPPSCCRMAARSRSSKGCRVPHPAIERLEGFKAGIASNPKITVVATQPVDWMQDKAVTVFSAMLQAHPDIKLVYTSNDLAAAGAYIAVKQGEQARPGQDHRHGRAARPVGRHSLGGGWRVGGDLRLSDRRGRGP